MILKQSNYADKDVYKFQNERVQVNEEINGRRKGPNYHPQAPKISGESFAKDQEERKFLKELKARNKALVSSKGLDPKKFMNIPGHSMGVKIEK